MQSVCVIGAGAAGLCAARHLSATAKFEIVVFEQSAKLGGTWRYTENPALDPHSSMYQNLRTNLPKEIMAFPDFVFRDSDDSFVHHSKVLQYLDDYASHFDLIKYIKFKTLVKHMAPKNPQDVRTGWIVTVENQNSEETLSFDAVIVCNGHYCQPYIPHIPGLDLFRGRLFHSHEYRKPDGIQGPVVVLGASSSGIDISLELAASIDTNIYLSHNHKEGYTCELPHNVKQVPGIIRATENGFIFSDGSACEAQTLVFCTGYCYSFPFLSENCSVEQPEYSRVNPLYKHLMHINFHSLFFIGIPSQIVPFPLFHYQMIYCVQVLSGIIHPPSQDKMKEEMLEDLQLRLSNGMPERHQHKMGQLQWSYIKELAHITNTPGLPQFYEAIYNIVGSKRKANIMVYRNDKYSTKLCGTIN